jgi:general L-amino acid transport system permease protein
LIQVLLGAAVAALVGWLTANVLDNLARGSITTGFGFLSRPANFEIGECVISCSAADSYARAFLVGLLNTLKVGVAGVVLATVLGTLIGVARLSSNWLAARLAAAYVEAVRNVPLLLQLFLWYAVITESLPGPRQALAPLPGVFLSNRGLMLPVPVSDPAWPAAALALVAALVVMVGVRRCVRRHDAATCGRFRFSVPLPVAGGLVLGLPLLAWLAFGAPTAMDVPHLAGFNFRGGVTLSPELLTLLLGLVIYTAAFIAEIVRSGILAVDRGQTEAARALGLSPGLTLRLVVLPQALRLIVPPLTSQYLNLLKNSSLAVAIGYPDVVSVLDTTINQTGQAIEGVSMIMGVFLVISLSLSALMNWYNARLRLR